MIGLYKLKPNTNQIKKKNKRIFFWPGKTIGDSQNKVIALDLPLARRKLPSWEREFLTMEPRKCNLKSNYWKHQGNSSCVQTLDCCTHVSWSSSQRQDRRQEVKNCYHTQTDYVPTILCPSKGPFVHSSFSFMKRTSKLAVLSRLGIYFLSSLGCPCANNECTYLAFLHLPAIG